MFLDRLTLKYVNKYREEDNAQPLVRLPHADPGDNTGCVVARALKDIDWSVSVGTRRMTYKNRTHKHPLYVTLFIHLFDVHLTRYSKNSKVGVEQARDLLKPKEVTVTKAKKVMSRKERVELNRAVHKAEKEIAIEGENAVRDRIRQRKAHKLQDALFADMWLGIGYDDEVEDERPLTVEDILKVPTLEDQQLIYRR